jgi:hypothetical protein
MAKAIAGIGGSAADRWHHQMETPPNLSQSFCDAIERAKYISRKPGLLSAEVDGEVVLMSLGEGCYFGLDDIASDVWKRLEKCCLLTELIDTLTQEYGASREVIEKDVINLLRAMAERDLVEFV